MKPEQFIREFGVEKAREVVPSLHCTKALAEAATCVGTQIRSWRGFRSSMLGVG